MEGTGATQAKANGEQGPLKPKRMEESRGHSSKSEWKRAGTTQAKANGKQGPLKQTRMEEKKPSAFPCS